MSSTSLAKALAKQHGIELRNRLDELDDDEPGPVGTATAALGRFGGWRPLGKVLLDGGLVSENELAEALAEKRAHQDRRLGAILVRRGHISGATLALALAEQHGIVVETEGFEDKVETVTVPVPAGHPTYEVILVGFPGERRQRSLLYAGPELPRRRRLRVRVHRPRGTAGDRDPTKRRRRLRDGLDVQQGARGRRSEDGEEPRRDLRVRPRPLGLQDLRRSSNVAGSADGYRGGSEADGERSRRQERRVVRAQRARRALAVRAGPLRLLPVRGRDRLRAGGRPPRRDAAGGADGDVPLGVRPGGLPRPLGRGHARHRGRGAAAAAVGLRPLPARGEARDRRRGEGTCLVLALGARINTRGEDWGGYTVDDKAARLGASAEEDTTEPAKAYARFKQRTVGPYQEGWLPD